MTPCYYGSGRSWRSWIQLVGMHAVFSPLSMCVCVCARVRARRRACACVCVGHIFAMFTLCVFAVMNLERIMEFWLQYSPRFKEEHGTYKGLVETLTEELVKLSSAYAMHYGWKSYSDHRPKHPDTKRTHDR